MEMIVVVGVDVHPRRRHVDAMRGVGCAVGEPAANLAARLDHDDISGDVLLAQVPSQRRAGKAAADNGNCVRSRWRHALLITGDEMRHVRCFQRLDLIGCEIERERCDRIRQMLRF